MPEVFSTWEIYAWLVRQLDPQSICPHCDEFHPRLILPRTFKRGQKLKWMEECKGTEFEVIAERA